MNSRDHDEKLWRYLGGQPPSREFSEMIRTDPAVARRLAELALIECAIREDAIKIEGQNIMRGRRLLLLKGVGAALAAIVVTFAGWKFANQPLVPGTPLAAEGGASTRELVSEIREGKRVRVSSQALKMAFAGEDTKLEFDPNSEVKFEESPQGGKRIQLDLGRLRAEVSPQESPFKVHTPHLSVEVVGTAFEVLVSDEASQVLVTEGIVEVDAKALKEPLRLPAGSGWKQNGQGRGFSVAGAAHTRRPPAIDQSNDAIWDAQPARPTRFLGESKTPVHHSESDHSSQWRAVWDEDALYVLIEVADDEVGRSNAKAWANDSAEIFIDADNSRGDQFDGINDHFLFFQPGDEAITPGNGALELRPGMTHQSHRTAEGFRVEVRLPWDALGVQPEPGLQLGFNVASNDSDESDDERSQLSWTPKFSNDWSRPDRMGFLILSPPDSN